MTLEEQLNYNQNKRWEQETVNRQLKQTELDYIQEKSIQANIEAQMHQIIS